MLERTRGASSWPACSVLIASILTGLATAPPVRADAAVQQTSRATLLDGRSVTIEGSLLESRDISAAALVGEFLFVGADEGFAIQRLTRKGPASFVLHARPIELPPRSGEIDVEAMASSGDVLYVSGSHSKKRKRVKKGSSHAKNRERMGQVSGPEERNQLFRLTAVNGDWDAPKIERISLAGVIRRDPILRRFQEVPSKENGIDIEGIASREGDLYVGFRGPVLRGGFAIVMKTSFDHPDVYELLFVDLGGRGIRSLASVPGGFLVVAGPIGDAATACELFFWDGSDGLPGRNRTVAAPKRFRVFPPNSKPEGLAVLETEGRCASLIVFSDGLEGGDPRLLDVCF